MQKVKQDREGLIKFIIDNGEKISPYSWFELGERFLGKGKTFDTTQSRVTIAEKARSYWRWYKKKGRDLGQYVPDNIPGPAQKSSVFTFKEQDKIKNFVEEEDIKESLTLKSKWQVQGKGGVIKELKSWTNNVTTDDVKNTQKLLIDSIKEYSPQAKKIAYEVNEFDEAVTLIINIPDIHFGKGPIADTIRDFNNALEALVLRAMPLARNNVVHIIVPIGNDFFHSEGYSQTTTKGTKLFDYAEWQDCFIAAKDMVFEAILQLSSIARVTVPIVQGNHDYTRSYYLGATLEGYFYNNPNVTIDNSHSTRKYVHFGENLIGFDHGELKPNDYPLIMATERPIEFSQSTNRIFFLGHLHHQKSYEFRGIRVMFLPSICSADEWHKKMGYDATRAAQCHIFTDKQLIGYVEHQIR